MQRSDFRCYIFQCQFVSSANRKPTVSTRAWRYWYIHPIQPFIYSVKINEREREKKRAGTPDRYSFPASSTTSGFLANVSSISYFLLRLNYGCFTNMQVCASWQLPFGEAIANCTCLKTFLTTGKQIYFEFSAITKTQIRPCQ